jgi:hypothetical protein
MEIATAIEPAPMKRGPGRPPCRSASFTLPTPPSTNARAWLKEAGRAIRAARIEKIPGHVAISVRAGLPTQARDLDNLLKPTIDALVSFAVIGDDKDVVRLTAGWAVDVAEGSVEVHVKQFPHPETCHRISTGKRAGFLQRAAAADIA